MTCRTLRRLKVTIKSANSAHWSDATHKLSVFQNVLLASGAKLPSLFLRHGRARTNEYRPGGFVKKVVITAERPSSGGREISRDPYILFEGNE